MVLVVASIDFGTTYSGWAYSFTHDYEKDPTDVKAKHWSADEFMSNKAPTCVLINPDGHTVEAFGYEAENKYEVLSQKGEHNDWFFFKHFKMKLFHNKDLRKNTMLEDATGKQLPALAVIAATIKYLKNDLMALLTDQITGGITCSDVNWVLTVPAIWNETAKQFMRLAAREAGIETGHMNIALEPEAASIFCRNAKLRKSELSSTVDISTFLPGTQYIVCDAGGGTVDVTVHEVTSDHALKEITKASGGAWGGTQVDAEFEKLIDQIAGCPVMQRLKETYMDEYMDLKRTFEHKKRDFRKSPNIQLRIPSVINDIVNALTGRAFTYQIQRSALKNKISQIRDKLSFDISVMESLFDRTVGKIIDHLSSLLCNYQHIKYIVMVGGFSDSTFFQQKVKEAFPHKHVIVPAEAGLAVLKGAVMFGHNKRSIVSRIARFTYGVKCNSVFNQSVHPTHRSYIDGKHVRRVADAFSKLVEIGSSISIDDVPGTGEYFPSNNSSFYSANILATKERQPVFADDPGCFCIGQFVVDCRDKNGKIVGTLLSINFGGTEIEVKAKLLSTGEETKATFDLPDPAVNEVKCDSESICSYTPMETMV